MQTSFSQAQLADLQVADSERILRTCVHCGFCTATCPTYVLDGNEPDSPRGRIYLIKDMLENDRPPTADLVKHIDRCLSCLACMTTCPSGVNYMHLVDHARTRIEKSYRRPRYQRMLRTLLARVLPDNRRFRWALRGARLARPLAPLIGGLGLKSLSAMLRLAPRGRLGPAPRPQTYPAVGTRIGRVALLGGCVGPVLAPSITAAAIRVLNRSGIEVVIAKGEGCCGALAHHLGRESEAHAAARRNIDAWAVEFHRDRLDAILVTASGCGTVMKDYGFMLRTDSALVAPAQRVSGLVQDITEYLARLDLVPVEGRQGLIVAYHSACSLQHGQKITREPKEILSKLGFVVKDVPEGHLCCGSAGTYNILQSSIARRLRERKVGNIEKTEPDVIAAGNIGCITQIAAGTSIPIVHTIELIDWATGGPEPAALKPAVLRSADRVTKAASPAGSAAARSEPVVAGQD
jgi:glycolate oxidase iron-sulfur subunit